MITTGGVPQTATYRVESNTSLKRGAKRQEKTIRRETTTKANNYTRSRPDVQIAGDTLYGEVLTGGDANEETRDAHLDLAVIAVRNRNHPVRRNNSKGMRNQKRNEGVGRRNNRRTG